MTKVSFEKIESLLEETFRKMFIQNLNELATITSLINDPRAHTTQQEIESIISRFQKELQFIKSKDKKLFHALQLSKEEEERLMMSMHDYSLEDWVLLKTLKERIKELKTELFGESATSESDLHHIEVQRKEHINKRHNVRKDWLPLH